MHVERQVACIEAAFVLKKGIQIAVERTRQAGHRRPEKPVMDNHQLTVVEHSESLLAGVDAKPDPLYLLGAFHLKAIGRIFLAHSSDF